MAELSTFDIVCMRSIPKAFAALFGLLTMLAGLALLLDGLLPVRSHGSNPSVVEVVAVLVICLTGFLVRRMARRTPTHPPSTL